MRRLLRLIPIVFTAMALAACGSDDEEAATPVAADSTRLEVEVTRARPEPIALALRCGGASPCERATLKALRRALGEAKDPARACTLQYGGPERAHVTGTLEGRTIDVTLTRANGCGIADYDALFAALGRTPPLAG